jgi:hypothetical protein
MLKKKKIVDGEDPSIPVSKISTKHIAEKSLNNKVPSEVAKSSKPKKLVDKKSGKYFDDFMQVMKSRSSAGMWNNDEFVMRDSTRSIEAGEVNARDYEDATSTDSDDGDDDEDATILQS